MSSIQVKAEVKRLREEQNRLRNITDGFPSEVEKILYQEGWRIMNKSLKIAPIDQGLLRASARVELPERDGEKIFVRLSYNTNYAKYVHERTDAGGGPVDYKAPGTRSLFLIDPLIENVTEFEERVKRRLEKVVRQNDG